MATQKKSSLIPIPISDHGDDLNRPTVQLISTDRMEVDVRGPPGALLFDVKPEIALK